MKFFIKDNIYSVCTESSYLFYKVKTFLEKNKYDVVDTELSSDIILINTCGVRSKIEKLIKKYILDIRKKGFKGSFYIFGCTDNSKDLFPLVDGIISIKKEYLFDKYFYRFFSIKDVTPELINKFKIGIQSFFDNGYKRYFLETNRGCIHSCTYCGTKRSIGYVKSKSLENIIKECKYAVNKGYDEIVLVSDDVGSWGQDIGKNFSDLYKAIYESSDNLYININYIEPSAIIKYFDKINNIFYKVSEMIYPVQSFNDRILKLMNRRYTVKDFIDSIKDIRKYNSKIKLTNHIIYAYPTETREEFKNNIRNAYLFDSNLFNLYSYIHGTKKYTKSEIISKDEKIIRTNMLLKLNKIDPIKFDLTLKGVG